MDSLLLPLAGLAGGGIQQHGAVGAEQGPIGFGVEEESGACT